MNKKILFPIVALIVLVFLLYGLTKKEDRKEPVTMMASSSIREMTIDEKIEEAELIIIGEVKTTLPSRWRFHNEKDTNNATPQEIFEAEGIFTDSIISIDQTLKGKIDEPTVRVRSFVGETEQVRWVDDSQVSYKQGQTYLLFLVKDFGPSQNVDPGDYISVNSNASVYEIRDGKAISASDEWILEDLVAYIKNSPLSTPTQNIPDTPEAQEIMQTIETAYDIEAEAAYTFDLTNFPTVFVNDPRYSISPDNLNFIRDVTSNTSLETAGYLDYKIAYYTWWQEGTLQFEALREKAKAENREITKDELDAFLASKWGMIPGRVKDPIRHFNLKFNSITIGNEVATAVLDFSTNTKELVLVLIDGKWYLAGDKDVTIFPADLLTPSLTSTPSPTEALIETLLPFTDTPVATELPT